MQINRLFQITYLLLDQKTVTARELAERLEVSRRTVYRDVETLSAAGIPIYMSRGKSGGISLLPDYVLNKAVLTEEERAGILSSLKAVAVVSPVETDTALHKLSGLFGESCGNADWIEVDFSSWGYQEEAEVFEALKAAVQKRKVVSFDYANSKGEQLAREIEPLKLCFKGQAWYVFGYCRKRNDFRFFKLRRIRFLQVSEETFCRDTPKQVLARQDVFDQDLAVLKMKISPEMAFRVYDEFSDFEVLPDGGFLVEARMPAGDWLYSYIFSFGEHCEVLSPENIRLEIQNALNRMLGRYFRSC